MRLSGAGRCVLGGALLGLVALGCGQVDQRGSVMLAISTDMYVDKDLSRVDIIVQPEHGPAQSTQVNLFPALEGRFLPGTFSIIEGSDPGEFVRVRLVARQSERVRVVREAALKVPRSRTALLSMPIQWLCDGHVRLDDQQPRSDCDEGYTCISGVCQLDEVDEATLPDYTSAEVFGGGNATGGGTCFDTLPCFSSSWQPDLDLDTCVLDAPASADLNVAAVLPPGGDGHCTASECWIPLDASALTGWSAADGGSRAQLPLGLCQRVQAGSASVRASNVCPSKSPSTPTCGPWSLVGTEPGDEGPLPIGPAVAGGSLETELDARGNALVQRVALACGRLAGQSAPVNPSPAELTSLCQLAGTAMSPVAPLSWYHLPARCWTDHDRQLSCERACSSDCDPGTVASRCALGWLAAECSATCSSRQCLGDAETPTDCAGACDGHFVGVCEGNCFGVCEGSCGAPGADGRCDAPCDGTCRGLCLGRGEGSCEGRCDGDPNLAAPICPAGTLCLAGCPEAASSSLSCATPLGVSPCPVNGCVADCGAIGRIDLSCEPATVWLLPPAGMDTALVTMVEQSLAELVSVRDAEAPPALDEATRRLTRLTEKAASGGTGVARAQAAVERLSGVLEAATDLLAAVGPARLGLAPGSGPGGGAPPLNMCEILVSPGAQPLIDDFEDGNAGLPLHDGRNGVWHVGWDGTGQISLQEPPLPEPGGANDSNLALHLSGTGQTGWGANLNVELRAGAAPYDASRYTGVSFWARGTGRLRVIFMQQNLAPGHPCSTCDQQSGECGLLYSTEVFLSSLWSQFILDWSSLRAPAQIGTPFSPGELMTIQFEAPAPDPIDFWLDDVAFYGP